MYEWGGLSDLGSFDGGYAPVKPKRPPLDVTQPLVPVPGGLTVPPSMMAPTPGGRPGQRESVPTGSAAGQVSIPPPALAPGAPKPAAPMPTINNGLAAARAAAPSGPPTPTAPEWMTEYMGWLREDREALKKRRDQNAAWRDQLRSDVAAVRKGNVWDVKNNPEARLGLARAQHGDAYDAFTAYNGTEGNMLNAAAASGRMGGAVDRGLAHAGENYRAAVKQAFIRRDDDWRQRAQDLDKWAIGMDAQLANADLAGDQINQLAGLSAAGYQAGNQGLLLPGQIAQQNANVDHIRASIDNLAAQNRMTRAEAETAEWVARNQGTLALLNFLANLGGNAGRVLGGM